MSAVTSTPDLSFGTDSRMTTDDSTHSGSSISVWRHEKERNSNGEAHTSFKPVVDVVERLAVEDRQVEAGAVEVVEILDVGVAADEAADALRLVLRLQQSLASRPSRMACSSAGESGAWRME